METRALEPEQKLKTSIQEIGDSINQPWDIPK